MRRPASRSRRIQNIADGRFDRRKDDIVRETVPPEHASLWLRPVVRLEH